MELKMKAVIAPDSFKGTLGAAEVCEIAARALDETFPGMEILRLPLSDGGEGMAEAWRSALGGTMRTATVSGPYGEAVQAQWLLLPDGTAVLETASCAGLELARAFELNPERTTTHGLGELMLCALESGARRILLGLGGSATCDAGCGMAHALGWRFLDKHGEAFCPTGGTLIDIDRILPPEAAFPLAVTAACDVDAPLYGPLGAACVYAPQKGADAAMVKRLDAGLRHISAKVEQLPASSRLTSASCLGAAGGLGFGVRVFLGGELRSGIELLLDYAGFDDMLADADFVITGEGRMDAQTLQGKAPCGVLRRAQKRGVPVIAVCGCLGDGYEELLKAGFAAIYPAVTEPRDIDALRLTCREDLYKAVQRAASLHQFPFVLPESERNP